MAILTSPAAEGGARRPSAAESANLGAWRLLGWIGAAFVVMGGTDVALAWYPSAFGRPEWEFGAITASLNGLALPLLGIFVLLAVSIAHGRVAAMRVIGSVMFVGAAVLLVLAFMYVTVVPLALNSVSDNAQLATGMKKAIAKASVLFVAYVTLLLVGGISGWRKRANS